MRHTFRRLLGRLTLTAAAVAGLTAGVSPPASATATAYYLDCSGGAAGDGTVAHPWNTLTAVNGQVFQPGEQLLIKRGTSCNGVLKPQGSGAAGAPVIVDTYGTGAKPLIAGGGAPEAVRLDNQQYWEIRNLEVTNHGATAGNRRGVYITLRDFGTGTHYRLTNLTVHDVNGDNTKDLGGSSGIHLDVLGDTTRTKFADVVLDGNDVYSVDRSGITMSTTWRCRASMGWDGCPAHVDNYYPWSDVIVRNNTVHDIGGDGIVMQYTADGLAEYNVAYDVNMRSGVNNAGIWAWNADGVTFQYNEAYRVRRPANTNDGTAFDIDYGTDRTVFQYNYSHDNEGGMILYCGCGGTSANGVVRYNVSQNDKSRIIMAAGATDGAFYNNTVYLGPGSTTKILEEYNTATALAITNNIIVNQGSGGYSYLDAHYASRYTFSSNILNGNHPGGPAGQLTGDPMLTSPGGAGTGISSAGGYQIAADSPAIGAGRPILGNGGRDYWGNPVPPSCAPDIGAHQRSPVSPGCARLANGGFESGSLTPWYAWHDASAVAGNTHGGGFALRLGTAPASAEQQVTVSPGTTYTLSGWAKTAGTGAAVRIGVKAYGGPETYATVTATSYTQGSVQFTTGASAGTATVYCFQSTGTGYAYCDDLTVT
ncbi:carbohydrate binding domain-containing protein [Amycolatopsis sp. PS_44_ISF1]|uniref:carbohydrate binding domain-containing protein n=1 Tax=Amycolatopsis sp. PS_44_ISF1 TaxID=2974917 RepID=UPI0028DE9BC0|nr:carbohydrate binding domain-containing protein [Amycolatopsis sp. PS_44_ISF1]MDT8913641.1 right-handed parallel beta-helix repeat-containing protein [Amycolatopsis sp. PS_44_ISF1]